MKFKLVEEFEELDEGRNLLPLKKKTLNIIGLDDSEYNYVAHHLNGKGTGADKDDSFTNLSLIPKQPDGLNIDGAMIHALIHILSKISSNNVLSKKFIIHPIVKDEESNTYSYELVSILELANYLHKFNDGIDNLNNLMHMLDAEDDDNV